MNFIRAELHNHSTESDGKLTIKELLDYAEEKDFQVLAITDHNTHSGQYKAMEYCKGKDLTIIPGIEITTFFGHILVLGINEMVNMTTLVKENIDPFLKELKKKGAVLVGVAHPFCIGKPLLPSCRFDMKINDFSIVDYIEIANTSAGDLYTGNEKALMFWENLVLSGEKLAAISGKDLHNIPREDEKFTTFIELENKFNGDYLEVLKGIKNRKSIVSKGPILYVKEVLEKKIIFNIDNNSNVNGWNDEYENYNPVIVIKTNNGKQIIEKVNWNNDIHINIPNASTILTAKLYNEDLEFKNLLSVCYPIEI